MKIILERGPDIPYPFQLFRKVSHIPEKKLANFSPKLTQIQKALYHHIPKNTLNFTKVSHIPLLFGQYLYIHKKNLPRPLKSTLILIFITSIGHLNWSMEITGLEKVICNVYTDTSKHILLNYST